VGDWIAAPSKVDLCTNDRRTRGVKDNAIDRARTTAGLGLRVTCHECGEQYKKEDGPKRHDSSTPE
jgi:hypothetical protein